MVELRDLSELIDQLDTCLFDRGSFRIEVRVLLSFRHLIIQE